MTLEELNKLNIDWWDTTCLRMEFEKALDIKYIDPMLATQWGVVESTPSQFLQMAVGMERYDEFFHLWMEEQIACGYYQKVGDDLYIKGVDKHKLEM